MPWIRKGCLRQASLPSAGTSHIRQGIRYPSHTCRNRRHSSSHRTSVRAYDILHILVGTADIPQVPATSNGFRQRIEHHHCLRADTISLLVHWTALGAGIFIANFFPITAETFWLISSRIPCNLNFKLVFFIQPFLHTSNSYSSSSHFFILQSHHI